MLKEVMRFKCRFTYPAIHYKLKKIVGEDDWMGFSENGEDPIKNFYKFVKLGLIEKDEDEVVIYMDMQYRYDFTGSLIGDKSVSVVFDNNKLKRAVPDMKTTVRFDQGVRIALEYIMQHPEYQVEDPEFDERCDKVIQALEKAKKGI